MRLSVLRSAMFHMMDRYVVYVLYSESTGRHYIGVTVDLGRRLRQHNGEISGGAASTRYGRPWLVERVSGLMALGDALRVEASLKRRRNRLR